MKMEILDGSADTVRKLVFEWEGDRPAVAEAVLYRYPDYETRTVICCSTQSGCPVGCRFCGAGDYFNRSLTGSEILEQVEAALNLTQVDPIGIERLQIMFMSMGEPMLSQKHLFYAIRKLHGVYPRAALLVSTSGPAVNYKPFRELSVEVPTVGLQFSVHESTDEARNRLIPYRNKMTLEEIAWEGEEWAKATGRRPFFNYCVHEGNNFLVDVVRLRNLFSPAVWEATLSVISERDETVASALDRQSGMVAEFADSMRRAGFSTRTFNPAGQDDIGGGCGQLWQVQKWMAEHPESAKPTALGFPVVHPIGGD